MNLNELIFIQIMLNIVSLCTLLVIDIRINLLATSTKLH